MIILENYLISFQGPTKCRSISLVCPPTPTSTVDERRISLVKQVKLLGTMYFFFISCRMKRRIGSELYSFFYGTQNLPMLLSTFLKDDKSRHSEDLDTGGALPLNQGAVPHWDFRMFYCFTLKLTFFGFLQWALHFVSFFMEPCILCMNHLGGEEVQTGGTNTVVPVRKRTKKYELFKYWICWWCCWWCCFCCFFWYWCWCWSWRRELTESGHGWIALAWPIQPFLKEVNISFEWMFRI